MHLHDVLDVVLERFNAATDVSVIETGTIRGNAEHDFIGDGWSTLYFAKHFHDVTSIDLDTSAAETIVRVEGVADRVSLIRDDSRKALRRLHEQDRRFDIAFLDSDNNPDLIFEEFEIVSKMMTSRGIIMIDDVELPDTAFGARKGARVLPYLLERVIPHKLVIRSGWNGYRTGVLVFDADHVKQT